MCFAPLALFPARIITKIKTANNAGTRMVVMRKARPRICSRYSRFATSRRLRIGFASHGLDEDFFERRFNKLEAIDCGHGCFLMQELLGIAVRVETNFGVA